MGCPQSKQKNKDITNIGSGINENGNSKRKDAVSPADKNRVREPTKRPHDYNDDPMVRGREDLDIPDFDSLDEKENGNEVVGDKTNVNGEIKEPTERFDLQNEVKEVIRPELNDKVETMPEKTEQEPPADYNDSDTGGAEDEGQNEAHNGKVSEEVMEKVKAKISKNMVDVFVPDDTESIESNEMKTSNNEPDKPTDITQIDIGNVVNEIELNQQITNGESVFIVDSNKTSNPGEITHDSSTSEVNTDRRPSGTDAVKTQSKPDDETKEDSGEGIETIDNYRYTDVTLSEFGMHNVRHIKLDKLEYGLPEGVPKPAPPKTKKADLIKEGTFTIADKVAEQTPDSAFGSVQKLSSYLTGEVKKDDIEMDDDSLTDGKNLPPIRPTDTRKKDIIREGDMFRKIDEHAKKTPESVKMSVEKLATYLCSVASTDLEKVRAIYFWICNNIGYMYDKSKQPIDYMRFDAVSTLRQGQGSYVNLMAALCKEAGIPVVTIPGCSKGLRHEPVKQFRLQERNHSWNAVYINSEWRFVDCTWGAGFTDTNGKFRRQFDEFWFLTDPEVFVYDHFPTHEVWQLLEEPIDIDEFNSRPSLTEKSREYGFQLISHREPIIYVRNEVTVTFGTKEISLSNITADLRNSDGKEINKHRCMQKTDSNTFSVRVIPPEIGQFALILYGKAKDYKHAKFMKLTEYMIRCDEVYPDKVVFPDHLKAWGAEPNYADHGFAKSIENLSVFKSDTNEMTLTLEQTRNVSIIPELKAVRDLKTELKDFAMITSRQNEKIVHVRFPTAGYYKLDIYAEREDEKYDFAASFLLECTVTESPQKLPKYNASSICKNTCELIEPLVQEIPCESTVVFRIRSPGLRSAMVGIPMEKDYGSRLKSIGELVKQEDEFLAQITTPKKGETVYLSGCAKPPNVFWSRLYEFVTV